MTSALVTGGAGRVASMLRPHLSARGWTVRLLDTRTASGPLEPGVSSVVGSILADTDLDAAMTVDAGAAGAEVRPVDVVVHLAGHPSEGPWDDLLRLNVDGTRRVLDACLRTGVRRVLLASSLHAAGFVPLDDPALAGGGLPLPRPDTYYGMSKAAMESLGALYADRFGLSVVSARIMYAQPAPSSPRSRVLWLSGADAGRLVAATTALTEPGHHLVWAVSRAGGRLVDLGPGRAIGFDPQDSAELPGDLEALGPGPLGSSFTRLRLGEDTGA